MKKDNLEKNISDCDPRDWIRQKKFGELSNTQCNTVFKITGYRCGGIYGHEGTCQDLNYPQKSADLEYGE